MADKEKEVTLEDMFAALEELTEQMEKSDVSLEQSFTLYNQGMEMLKKCNETIDAVEKKVMVLDSQGREQEF